MRLRQVRNNYQKWEKKAKILQSWALEEFDSEKKNKLFADKVFEGIDLQETNDDSWLEEIGNIVKEYE